MRPSVGSVFSGIGGFDEGFRRAGFDIRWMCEREPFCRKVLAQHFPGVPCFDDVTTLTEAPAVDVLVGGFPCQDVSIAGQRRGLSGERSGLFFQFARLLDLLKPETCVIENVDGLLSNDLGSDFATVIAHLENVGYVGGWRVLDSQWFGVPQRRERVFFVSCRRGQLHRAKAVLFESARGTWDSAPRRQTRARVAATLRGRSHGPGVNEPGRGGEDDVNLIAFTLPSVHRGVGNGHNTNYLPTTGPLGGGNDGIGRRSEDDPNLIVAACLNSGGNSGGFRTEPGEHLVLGESQSHALTASNSRSGRYDPNGETFVVGALGTGRSPNGHGYKGISVQEIMQGQAIPQDRGGVRRLTPLECERLQGFPDGWTCLCGEGHRGSQYCTCPDTPRYKALGNAVTVPVAEWIARRLMAAWPSPDHERE